jgi:maltose alpha-D-glucosyltransferase/alpha-amylase
MGDNIYLGDRNGVRTPMQWNGDRNAGFSRADPARLYAPPIMDAVYGYQSINVEAQERYPFSLLNWMKRLMALRKRHTVFGRGTLEFVDCSNRKVIAYIRRDDQETMLIVGNLARTSQPAALDLRAYAGLVPVESFGDTEFPRVGDQPYTVTLMPYGFLMFRLQQAVESVTARPVPVETPVESVETRPALLAGVAWDTLLDGALRRYIECEALPTFLPRQRWFGHRTATLSSVRLVDWSLLRAGSQPVFLTVAEAAFADGTSTRYFLPLATVTGAQAERVGRDAPAAVVARITGARKGLLIDAVYDDHACTLLLESIAQQRDIATQQGVVRARQTPLWLSDAPQDVASVARGAAEQSNSSIRFGSRKILKLFRRLEYGVNPEIEIGRHLVATGFPRVPPFAGWLEYEHRQGEAATLGMLQGLVHNQGDAWDGMLDELSRFFDRTAADSRTVQQNQQLPNGDVITLASSEPPEIVRAAIGVPLTAAATLGLRTAEMHMALAAPVDGAAFAPEPLEGEHLEELVQRVTAAARTQLAVLASADVPETIRPLVDRVGKLAVDVEDRVRRLAPTGRAGARIRVHGDYHLGQLLWSEQDFYILDFEGEPARPLAERRAKESPLKDVAGMLRSFSYAATAGLLAFERRQPGSVPAFEPWALLWERWISAAFLGAYRRMLAESPLLPQGPDFIGLLALFSLEKAFYELRYEMNNRPDWLRIPLVGVAHLLSD